jgi:YD repeat-containing protein
VNGRPLTSIDAAGGAVPATPVAIGRQERTRTLVEAQAWDRAGRLVAARRIAVRTR